MSQLLKPQVVICLLQTTRYSVSCDWRKPANIHIGEAGTSDFSHFCLNKGYK